MPSFGFHLSDCCCTMHELPEGGIDQEEASGVTDMKDASNESIWEQHLCVLNDAIRCVHQGREYVKAGPCKWLWNCIDQSSWGQWWKWWSLNHIRLLVTSWTVAHQAPLFMGFSRQEYWSELPFTSRDLLDPGIIPGSPAVEADSLPVVWKDRGFSSSSWLPFVTHNEQFLLGFTPWLSLWNTATIWKTKTKTDQSSASEFCQIWWSYLTRYLLPDPCQQKSHPLNQ